MGFPKQEYSIALPCPPPGDLLNPVIEPTSPALQEDSLPSEPSGKPHQGLGKTWRQPALSFSLFYSCQVPGISLES